MMIEVFVIDHDLVSGLAARRAKTLPAMKHDLATARSMAGCSRKSSG
ncbi:MAG: hypothetical protein WKF30_17165 [Pyrinomonadaceae bacterium]